MLTPLSTVSSVALASMLAAMPQSNSTGDTGQDVAKNNPKSGNKTVLADGETWVEPGDRVVKLELDGGTTLDFIEFEPGNIGILEFVPSGQISTQVLHDELQTGEIAEVFFAFSRKGEAIPAPLLDASPIYSQAARPLALQGWGRTALRAALATGSGTGGSGGGGGGMDPASNCNNANFKAIVNSFGYSDRGTPDFRLNKKPDLSGFFKSYMNGGYKFYRYVVGGNKGSIWHNVDRYYSRVAVCAIDNFEPANPFGAAHPPSPGNPHMGPSVRFRYRTPGSSKWKKAAAHDFAANQVGGVMAWHFFTGQNWDWRTEIFQAAGDDEFDIGHALDDL